ncbi:MAG: tripartite tricarboxylate transporter substrate binding protein [Rhodoplanes sp.]|uniref:Bug family tripartite tricarboxylate transporter substrate binding protein n=1 Tax=Rhodoplanes sp. TaxID=1968906 RepID=UPI0018194F06|nr:tripartite tricarboxylate transporter substrate binding protein [Rhodoplanes sp.]NVO17397.1 tripartite tricarboxylate transporter substrate binding protein [Rhodoplanes sp.]
MIRALPSRHAARLVLALAIGLLPVAAQAQTFPQNYPITMVVPFVAGAGTDAIARDLVRYLQAKLGHTIVVDNRGGAGGTIAAQAVARAKPDGHTLLFVTSTFITTASIDRKLGYDVLKDFTPIALLGRGPLLLVANKDIGIDTVEQLVARAKAKPGALNYVSAGVGSINHLSGELFRQRTGTVLTHIPYRGSAPAAVDVMGGQAELFFATVPTMLGQVRGNTVKLIAVTSRERSALFPDTPTVMEAGVKDFDVSTWWGVVGPPGMSKELLARLNEAINEAATGDGLVKRFEEEGAAPFRGSPEAFGEVLKRELDIWQAVVRQSGVTVD